MIRTLEGVTVIKLDRTEKPRYQLAVRHDGKVVKGTTSSVGRWSHLLVKVAWDTRKGRAGKRLEVIARSETETAMRHRIKHETGAYVARDKSELYVFEIPPAAAQ